MAVNVPLVHISDLTEQTTAADTDYMVIGGADAKKIKWSTIFSLIKTKLGLGTAASKNVVNNLTTASSGGGVLDAYQGKVLKDSIDKLNTDLIDIQSGTLTLQNGFKTPSVAAYQPLCAKRCLSMITLYGFVQVGSIKDWTTITKLPTNFCPSKQLRYRGSFENKEYNIMVGSDGTVQIFSTTNVAVGNDIFINLTY